MLHDSLQINENDLIAMQTLVTSFQI